MDYNHCPLWPRAKGQRSRGWGNRTKTHDTIGTLFCRQNSAVIQSVLQPLQHLVTDRQKNDESHCNCAATALQLHCMVREAKPKPAWPDTACPASCKSSKCHTLTRESEPERCTGLFRRTGGVCQVWLTDWRRKESTRWQQRRGQSPGAAGKEGKGKELTWAGREKET